MSTQKTNMAHGDPKALVEQAVGVLALSNGRNTQMNNLTGKFPQASGAAATIKNQSSNSYPVVKAENLGKGKGDELTFNLINPTGGKPIMGSKIAQGKGVGAKLTEGRLRVNQARFVIDMGDQMSQIRSPVDMRKLGRPMAQSKMDRYLDQSLLTHMAGARGFHDNFEWIVPTENDPEFAEILVNPVVAPTKNRHFMAKGGGVELFQVNAGEIDIASTDLMKMGTVDAVRAYIEQIPAAPPPVIFDGDEAATDSPIRVMLASPAQYSGFATDPAFRQYISAAHARANQAKRHPLFLGECGLWNGILIIKHPKPVRFYAGDTIRYCAAYDTEVESTCIVPASFTDNFAVDRAILLGGQAVAQAFAASEHSGMPFFWKEAPGDFDDKLEIAIGAILGMAKVRFEVDMGNAIEFTDHGVAVLDTVVPIIGARK